MDLYTAMLERRSVRSYQSEPIPEEILEQIMAAAVMAPSAVNLQPWYFVVIKSEGALEKLKTVMEQVAAKMFPNLEKRFPNHPEVVKETNTFITDLGGAPVCVLVFQYKTDYSKTESSILQSISAAIENLMLAAWGLGVGSCWLTAPVEAGMEEVLRESFAPDKGEFVAMVTLGYAEKIPKAPKRRDGRVSYL